MRLGGGRYPMPPPPILHTCSSPLSMLLSIPTASSHCPARPSAEMSALYEMRSGITPEAAIESSRARASAGLGGSALAWAVSAALYDTTSGVTSALGCGGWKGVGCQA